jgi:hypothetical protein
MNLDLLFQKRMRCHATGATDSKRFYQPYALSSYLKTNTEILWLHMYMQWYVHKLSSYVKTKTEISCLCTFPLKVVHTYVSDLFGLRPKDSTQVFVSHTNMLIYLGQKHSHARVARFLYVQHTKMRIKLPNKHKYQSAVKYTTWS